MSNQKERSAVMKKNARQYLKYKDKFKRQGIISIVASACMLLTLILFIFLPCFKIDLIEGLDVEGISFSFSLYDEIALSFSHMFDINFNNYDAALILLLSLYQVMAIVYIGVGAIALVKDLVVSFMNTMNLNDYALTEYDKIKSKQDQRIGRAFRRFNSTAFFVSGIVLEIFAILLSKIIVSADIAPGSLENVTSYFVYMNSVTGSLYIVIIFLLLSAGLIIAKSHIAKSIKMQILKEDYDLSGQEEQEDAFQEDDDE